MGEKHYKLTFRLEPDYLYVRVTGIRSIANIVGIAEECQKACDEHVYKKILINAQRMTGELSILNTYDLGRKEIEKLRRSTLLKTAVVDLEKNRKRFEFFENVLVNSGFNVRFFSSDRDAKRWLGESKDISNK